jgi:enoyl-CoA hydratase/carnithine racemase
MGTALDWMISGRVFPAAEALEKGLVHKVFPTGTVLDEAYELAREIIANTAPVSVAVTRQLLYRMASADSPFPVHELDSRLIGGLGANPDAVEGVLSFLQKRPPSWGLRVDKDLPPYLPWSAE